MRSIHRGYEIGARMAEQLARRDPRPASQGEIVPSAARPFDNFPTFITRAEGAHLWDVDGNRYVDFLLGYPRGHPGAQSPGDSRAARFGLDEAVCQAPFWSPSQLQLVDASAVIPGAEMSFLLRTGSDATSSRGSDRTDRDGTQHRGASGIQRMARLVQPVRGGRSRGGPPAHHRGRCRRPPKPRTRGHIGQSGPTRPS